MLDLMIRYSEFDAYLGTKFLYDCLSFEFENKSIVAEEVMAAINDAIASGEDQDPESVY